MSDALLIGAQGWDHPEWHGRFYPEELPPEWRLTYYNNLLRAVLAPDLDNSAAANIQAWADDTDASFRFVVRTPSEFADPDNITPARLADFAARLAPLGERVAGVLWRVAVNDPAGGSALPRAAQAMASQFRACVEWQGSAMSPEWVEMFTRSGLGMAWMPASAAEPIAAGRLVVALVNETEPRAQRAVLERLVAVQATDRSVAAFFATPAQAQQARTLAELMGV